MRSGVVEDLALSPVDVSITRTDGLRHWGPDDALEAAQRHGMIITLLPTRETYVYSAKRKL